MNPLLQSVIAALQSGAQKEAIAQIDRVVEFFLKNKNDKIFGSWGTDIIRLMVAYHWAKNTLIVSEKDGEIDGVFMWYRCNANDGWEFVDEWKPDRPDGDAVFLAFLHCNNNDSLRRGVLNFIEMVPDVFSLKLFAFRVKNKKPTLVTYSPKLFQKLLTIKEHNGFI